jgi:drug/metabolite transporter (DMT)-like permease
MSALISCQYCISRTGIVLPSVFSRMGGLLVPLAFSILLFGEMPGAFQIIGSVLAITGILMMTAQGRSGQKISCIPILVLVLITEGVANSMTKVYQETGNTVLSDQFLLYTFMSACLLCVITLIARRERPGLNELIFGTLIGVPNFINTHFMLRTLERMPAVIVYPSRSVGALALITLTGILVFKEKLSRRQVIAMVIIVAALLLLNL